MELTRIIVAAVLCTGCRSLPGPAAPTPRATRGELALFRDGAVVRDVIYVELASPNVPVTVTTSVPSTVSGENVVVVPHDDSRLSIASVRVATPEGNAPKPVEIQVSAPKPGRYALQIAYTTTDIAWQAAYTMTTDAQRRRATLRGAIAVTNATGIAFGALDVVVIDTAIDEWRAARSGVLLQGLFGTTPGAKSATPRSLGSATIPRGETRIELLANEPPRDMRSVLVFDPWGTTLDHADAEGARHRPYSDAELGVRAGTRVMESFEITRPKRAPELPAGPIRLLARQPDGTLAVIGEAQLDASSRDLPVDTIAVGTAEGITAKRRRVELTDDPDHHRMVEEFEVSVTNTRAVPVEVTIREHAYRGSAWSLAFSTGAPEQAGLRAFTLRVKVPAKGTAKSSHTIVYTWSGD